MTVGRPCYLDHNATAPLHPAAAQAMSAAALEVGNPSSAHSFGRAARRLVEEARRQIATLLGARPEDVVFTGGGTEANNLALRGCGRDRILASAVEHPSVLDAADDIDPVPVDGDGVVDLEALQRMLERDTRPAIVSVMLANNETGVVHPVAEATRIAHRSGALIHCDAAQAPGRLPLDFGALGVDLLTVSAHKMGGPKGVGALVVGERVFLRSVMRGGGQERSRRAGTENLPGIAGFAAAAAALAEWSAAATDLTLLRDRLEDDVRRRVPDARIVGDGAARLPNTSCIALPGVSAETQVMALDLAGFAVSAGSACSSGKVTASHVLRAMGLPDEVAGCAIRISLGAGNTAIDMDRFLAAYAEFAARMGKSAA